MNSERAEELEAAFFEGELTAEELAEFERQLSADESLLQRVCDRYEIHRALNKIHQPSDPRAFSQATISRVVNEREAFVGSLKDRLRGMAASAQPPTPRFNWRRIAVPIAAVLAFAIFIYALRRDNNSGDSDANFSDSGRVPVATLVRTSKVRWEPDVQILEGERLRAGALRLGVGRAVLLFDSGAVVAVQAPAHLYLESRSVIRVDQGRVTVRAEGDATGFMVRTPAGDAQDLGTEFTVGVQVSGAAEVHVQKGEVAWLTKPGAPPSRILRAGAAVRFDSLKEVEGHPIAFVEETLDEVLRQISSAIPPRQPTVYEPFSYESGELSVEQGSGGSGWAGPWRLRRGAELTRETDRDSRLSILRESLQFPPLVSQGGALQFAPGGHSVRIRQLAEPIDLGREGVYYISFLLRREVSPGESAAGVPHFRLTLRRSSDFWGPSVGAGFPDTARPTLQLYSRDTFVAPFTVGSGVTTFWVLKIVTHRNQPDEAFLKVFTPGEAIPRFEPTPWSVVADRFPADGVLDLAVVTSSGPVMHIFDELRVGSTWESVTVTRKD